MQSMVSEWYTITAGTHQGGYLSLTKYEAFINSLLVQLEESGLCCTIYNISTSPLEYEADNASASTSKRKIDTVLEIVEEHSENGVTILLLIRVRQ